MLYRTLLIVVSLIKDNTFESSPFHDHKFYFNDHYQDTSLNSVFNLHVPSHTYEKPSSTLNISLYSTLVCFAQSASSRAAGIALLQQSTREFCSRSSNCCNLINQLHALSTAGVLRAGRFYQRQCWVNSIGSPPVIGATPSKLLTPFSRWCNNYLEGLFKHFGWDGCVCWLSERSELIAVVYSVPVIQ